MEPGRRFGVVFLLGVLCAAAADARPLRFILIGDSLVQGGRFGTDDYSFRYPLYRGLRSAGYSVDFVGVQRQGLDPDFRWPPGFDTDHEGFYGATSAEIEIRLAADLPRVEAPDWAVFLLGENDGTEDPNLRTIAPLRRMIGALRDRNPRVGVVIVQVPGFWRELLVHWKVFRLAGSLTTAVSPVTTVSLHDHWEERLDTYDGDHPNARGQAKIAGLVLQTLLPMLP